MLERRSSQQKGNPAEPPESSKSRLPEGVVPLREQQGAVTRRAILQAARGLFPERGFAGVTMKALADAAGVAVQTIYSTFGSKAGVLMGLIDLLDEEAGVIEIFRAIQATDDPREAIGLSARSRRQIRERCGDIVRTLRMGAAADAQVAVAWREGMRRRRYGLEALMKRIEGVGGLKEGLTPTKAAEIAAALTTDEVCDVLVEQNGWSFDEFETWLRETLATLLLRD